MLFPEQKLVGVCDLGLSDESYEKMPCVLDLETGEMEIQVKNSDPLSKTHLSLDLDIVLKNLSLETPLGRARATFVENTLLTSINTGGMWVGETALSYLFEETPKHIGRLRLVFNSPIELTWDCNWNEIIVWPGFDLRGIVEVSGICKINGRKNTLSLLDLKNVPRRTALAALSISVGAPVRVLGETKDGHLKLFLNRRKGDVQASPLFYRGWPFADVELARNGFAELFYKCCKHIEKLEKEPKIQFINAVEGYLEGKSVGAAYNLKLLAVIHFLEWLDGAKTFNRNQLVSCLEIQAEEAEAIVSLRNGLIHNRQYIRDIVGETYKRLESSNSDRFSLMRKPNPEIAVLNYLYSVCGEALLRRIGFNGTPQDYLPTKKVE